jgi:CRISPR system Cascade subunit CasD
MKGVLLIACVGPMQSWGTRSRFQERDTEREPTKSGMIGMLCAALGRDRNEPVDDLAALVMGVRIDREGILRREFQTAQDVIVAGGKSWEDLISNRYYLADASFLVGFHGDLGLLSTLHLALRKPRWPLFLGRKSYLPSIAPYLKDGLVQGADLEESLGTRPLLLTPDEIDRRRQKIAQGGDYGRIRVVLESLPPTREVRRDQPVSFALGRRLFRERYLTTQFVDISSFPGGGDQRCFSRN